jgi:hypothetical protein
MPFTPAHPAIVLPFLRSRYFSATGLIMGSMAPDFEYFIRMNTGSEHGHTLPGLFYFDLPVSLLFATLFHLVVKKSLVSNLPVFFQHRFCCSFRFNFLIYLKKHYLIFMLSVLAGAFTHILWDSFTHNTGYFAQRLDVYKNTFISFLGIRYPLFFVLQQLSTLLGLVIVLTFIIFLKPQFVQKSNKPSLYYWLSVMLITFVVTGIRFAFKSSDLNLGNFVVVSISGFCVALIVAGMYPRFNFQS